MSEMPAAYNGITQARRFTSEDGDRMQKRIVELEIAIGKALYAWNNDHLDFAPIDILQEVIK